MVNLNINIFAIKEIDEIEENLKNYSPSQVIWDIEDLSKTPPWGDNISGEITDFLTILLQVMEKI
jgi:hypothetical protein